MDDITKDMLNLMKEFFGPTGSFLLSREMKNLGYKGIKELNDIQKLALLDALVENVFSEVCAVQRLKEVKQKLAAALRFTEKTKEVMAEIFR